MNERTLSIIKPDAVRNGHLGAIFSMFERNGLTILGTKMLWPSPATMQRFYAVHKERPFFSSMVSSMCSGPVVVSVLEGEDAIAQHRRLMGATDPAQAEAGTIRKLFGENIERNACHGSDGPETAKVEIAHFFSDIELFPRTPTS